MTWIDDAKRADVVAVANALGMTLDRGNRALRPCPACGAEFRSNKTKQRGPAGIRPDRQGWSCFRCKASGDAINLVAWRLAGGKLKDLDTDRKAEVRAWYAGQGWCDGVDGVAIPNPRPLPPAPPPEPLELSRPDPVEVRDLWNVCLPVTDDPAVAGWLKHRGFDAGLVEDRDIARALPMDLELPRWAHFRGKPWNSGSQWRCVSPAWGPDGHMESLRARSIAKDVPPGEKAAAAAAGPGSATGLVLADGLARQVLTEDAAPSWWPKGKPLDVLVVEGETDFLAWGTRYGDAAEAAPAVIGVWAGSWTDDLAARIPDGSRVSIRTDSDDAGDKYARKVWLSLAHRCNLSRPKGNQ